MDYGHDFADKKLKEIEKNISKRYKAAEKEIKQAIEDLTGEFESEIKEKQDQLKSGKITEKEYDSWLAFHLTTDNWKEQLKSYISDKIEETDNQIYDDMLDPLIELWSENYNYSAYQIEKESKAEAFTVAATAAAVAAIVSGEKKPEEFTPNIPYARTDKEKNRKWIYSKVESAIIQGMKKGESIPKLTKRVMLVSTMSKHAATRTARTFVTYAENSARNESYKVAINGGISIKKRWIATLDQRTRASHRSLDGETVDVNKPFSNGLMFPGDRDSGQPAEYYNCRCTMAGIVEGFTDDNIKRISKIGSYEAWKGGKNG